MQHYRSLDDVRLQGVWLTIGSFDGVHLGHQKIITDLTAGAHSENVPAVVLTFHPHPAVVLRKRQDPYYLTNPDERAKLLNNLGIDTIITHPFNFDVAKLSALDFISKLNESLSMRYLIVGDDFALGRGREGDIPTLRRLGKQFGYSVEVAAPVKLRDQIVSSSTVRAALRAGDVRYANNLLGRPYQLAGKVIHGDGRGRTLGIPTANLEVWTEQIIPSPGVYACHVVYEGQTLVAVTNIGMRPTFESQQSSPRIEAHLLDFDHELYGKQLDLSFMARLRNEKRFQDVAALVDQIHKDIIIARKLLNS